MGWFGCVLIGTLAKVQVFGGLRKGIGFCIFDCSFALLVGFETFVGWGLVVVLVGNLVGFGKFVFNLFFV